MAGERAKDCAKDPGESHLNREIRLVVGGGGAF